MNALDGNPQEQNENVWERVARHTRSRRLELGMTQQEAAEKAGLSLATWRLVESAGRDRYQELTRHGVCRALGWRHDAFDQLTGPQGADVEPSSLISVVPEPREPIGDTVPSGLSRSWHELTTQEQSMVQGFVEGLLASRR